jgi:hypothetical protein
LLNVANELRDKGGLDEEECFIDATFVMAKGGGSEIGTTKRGKGMKIMAIVDALHVIPGASNCHRFCGCRSMLPNFSCLKSLEKFEFVLPTCNL